MSFGSALVDAPRVVGYGGGMDYKHLITVDPDKRSGQPCVRGLRMTVRDVLEYLAGESGLLSLLGAAILAGWLVYRWQGQPGPGQTAATLASEPLS